MKESEQQKMKYLYTGLVTVDELIITQAYLMAEDYRDITCDQLAKGVTIRTDPLLDGFVGEILSKSGKDKIADLRRARQLLSEAGNGADLQINFVNGDIYVDFAKHNLVDSVYNSDGAIVHYTDITGDIFYEH